MSTATAQLRTDPWWCTEQHTEATVRQAGFVFHLDRRTGTTTAESGQGEEWVVGLMVSDDGWAGVFVEGGDNGMTAQQARAMARSMMDAADELEGARVVIRRHVGAVVAEALAERGVTGSEVAEGLGTPETTLCAGSRARRLSRRSTWCGSLVRSA